MAGLFDLVQAPSDGGDKLSSHLFDAALVLYATGDITGPQAKAALESSLGRSFTASENTDINAIVSQMDGKSTSTEKLVYEQKIMACFIAVEHGQMGETQWRSILGIS